MFAVVRDECRRKNYAVRRDDVHATDIHSRRIPTDNTPMVPRMSFARGHSRREPYGELQVETCAFCDYVAASDRRSEK